ncbi:hypothetical protein R1flu_026574 [Riccia fluitans]|uniref:Uncharacterized protein n=1 Tax=Riccia fluitans TaxID=41844 RepID=A0ABD1XGC7_9MARC
MEAWGLGGLFAADWSQAHEDLVKELSGHFDQKVAFLKYEYHGKSEVWTSEVWREVNNQPKASLGGYVMKGKVQFTELQLLKLVKGDKRLSKSGVLLEQVEGNSNFILFCQILNSVLVPVRPEHFQHNQLAFYHYAWLTITDPTCTYAGLGRCGGKDDKETSEGAWNLQQAYLLKFIPCALVLSFP